MVVLEVKSPGPKMWNQDPRLAGGGGGGNLYKTERQCPGPKMRSQDPRLAGGRNLYKTESQGKADKGRREFWRFFGKWTANEKALLLTWFAPAKCPKAEFLGHVELLQEIES